MVHKPKHKVHSFRGLLVDGGQDEINLERSNVNLAYRIVKFQVMTSGANTNIETAVKIYREEQTTVTAGIDFTETDLLAASLYNDSTSHAYMPSPIIVFDNTLFSRNIYVTNLSPDESGSMNYYIELEEVPVSAATLMQLKLAVARKLNLSEDPPEA